MIDPAFSLASWNLRSLRGARRGPRVRRVLEYLAAHDPDVLALHEVLGRDDFDDLFELLPGHAPRLLPETELRHLADRARHGGLRFAAPSHPSTWWNGRSRPGPAPLDHVLAADHLAIRAPGAPAAEVRVRGWPEFASPAERREWIARSSDHALLLCEVLPVASGASRPRPDPEGAGQEGPGRRGRPPGPAPRRAGCGGPARSARGRGPRRPPAVAVPRDGVAASRTLMGTVHAGCLSGPRGARGRPFTPSEVVGAIHRTCSQPR